MMKLLKHKYGLVGIIAPFFIILDQVTKVAILNSFRYGESLPIIPGFFNLVQARNKGAAFSFLASAPDAFRVPFFIIVPLLALGAILYILKHLEKDDWKMATALALVISGAVGNLIDRVRLGFVVDFLDFHWKYRYHFPAFNVADIVICVGVGLLVLDMIRQGAEEARAAKAKKS